MITQLPEGEILLSGYGYIPKALYDACWITTYSGLKMHLFEPDPAKVNIYDISSSLSKINRYNGHTKLAYSVAEHSVKLCDYCHDLGLSALTQYFALLHDAGEYLIGDTVKPLKDILKLACPWYVEMEKNIEAVIWGALGLTDFGLQPHEYSQVKKFDYDILGVERDQALHRTEVAWGIHCDPMELKIEFWPHSLAAFNFLIRFDHLRQQLGLPMREPLVLVAA
jgi:uncharacterized protein